MTPATCKQRLRSLRARRQRLTERSLELQGEQRLAVKEALEAGLSAPEIARNLGVTHQYVYKMISQDEAAWREEATSR
jgi:hypothetical protein